MRDKAYRRETYRIHQDRWKRATAGNRYDPMRGWYDKDKERMVEGIDSTARAKLKRMSNKRVRRTPGICNPKRAMAIRNILY